MRRTSPQLGTVGRRDHGEKLRISSCPGRGKENMTPSVFGYLYLGIGRQGDELNDLSKSLGTRVPLLPCGLPHQYQSYGPGWYVSKVPWKQASEFYCVLLSPLQGLQGLGVGRPEGQKLSEHFFPSALSATHVAQLYPLHPFFILHPPSLFPSTSLPGIRASFCFTLSSSQCLHLSPSPYQPVRACFYGSALDSLVLL